MLHLILFLIYILLILGVIFIEHKDPQKAILWVVVLICLPYFGSILYLIFGNTIIMRVIRVIRTRMLSKEYRQNFTKELKDYKLNETNMKCNVSEADRGVIRFNSSYNGTPLTGYESVKIFTDGESNYRCLFEDIKKAKHSIHIQYYTIHNDEVGHALVKALTKKAAEGLEVWVMCDFLANLSSPPKMFRPLKEAGGKFKRLKPYLTHYRSHKKIVVIDKKIGFIGGMNVGGQYANLAKVKNPWRDTQVRLTGECVKILEYYFLTDWVCANSSKELASMDLSIGQNYKKNEELKLAPLQFVSGGADTDKESIKMCYLSMIRNAKKNIYIQSPYFIPDVSILDELKAAAASGVKINLMIPGIKASFFLDPVTTYYCGQLLEYGATVHKYKGYIHAKTMIIDDELCCIGSVNMDIRSLQVDDEICGVFYDNDFVRIYNEIYQKDIKNCTQYTLEEFKKRGTWSKVKEDFFLLFAPLM